LSEESAGSLGETVQFVTFTIGNEAYGIPVEVVGEVIHMQPVADVPGVPPFIEGITNLRGNVVPVVNVRMRLGLPQAPENGDERIMVVEHNGESIGFLVDDVQEVVEVAVSDIEPPSPVVCSADTDFILGIAKTDAGFVIVLDIDQTLDRGSARARASLPAGGETIAGQLPAAPAG